MNWGKTITLVILLFMTFILSMVFRAFSRDADLVREDYYENEINFDKNKLSKNNYENLGESISIDKIPAGVQIHYPSVLNLETKGEISFYRPDQKKYDCTFDVKVDTDNKQILPYDYFKEGYYDIQIEWSSDEKNYRYQSSISF